jgi:hypothetical protein
MHRLHKLWIPAPRGASWEIGWAEVVPMTNPKNRPHIRGIYGLFEHDDPSRIRYVGSSDDVEVRLNQHRGAVAAAWLSLDIRAVLLAHVPKEARREELLKAERRWISRMLEVCMADLNKQCTSWVSQ